MTAVRAWVGLGSNLDNPPQQLRKALQALAELPATRLGDVSQFYRSAPIGPQDQPDFCNAVVQLHTELSADALLGQLQTIELNQGRRRTRHWGERSLDLDLLLYGDVVQQQPVLTLPHPRMHERAFVLVPLAALAPQLVVPGHGSVASLSAAVAEQKVALWDVPCTRQRPEF